MRTLTPRRSFKQRGRAYAKAPLGIRVNRIYGIRQNTSNRFRTVLYGHGCDLSMNWAREIHVAPSTSCATPVRKRWVRATSSSSRMRYLLPKSTRFCITGKFRDVSISVQSADNLCAAHWIFPCRKYATQPDTSASTRGFISSVVHIRNQAQGTGGFLNVDTTHS